MTAVLRLNEQRLDRVGWRLDGGRRFSLALPERTLKLRQSDVCLIVADEAVVWDGDGFVPDTDTTGASLIGLARIRSSPRPTTVDDRFIVSEATLIEPLAISKLAAATVSEHRTKVRLALRSIAMEVNGPAANALGAALFKLRPDLEGLVAHLQRRDSDEPVTGEAGEILVMERDATRLAVSIAGLDAGRLQEWSGPSDDGFLASIAYETPEDALVSYDASRFPDWTTRPGGRPDWITLSDGESHIRIGNVNKTRLENTLGVDLIYRHLEADSIVLVQYKRMRRDSKGEWFYRPDQQLGEELTRMRRIDAAGVTRDEVTTWRLHPRGCFLKLVRQPKAFDPASDRLLSGIYLPLAYLDELLVDKSTLTSRGARRLGYDTIDRYLTNDLFVALVRQGWIGTRGITTKAVGKLIDAAVHGGRSVIVAEEWGAQTGAVRRRRPTPE